MLIKKNLTQFTDALASAEPVPGGGGVAALNGALGAALCSMVLNLTQGEKFADVAAEVNAINAKATDLRAYFLAGVDKDAEVFNGLMACYKLMPKSTDAEKKVRSAAIQKATQKATQLPLEMADKCLEVIKLAQRVLIIGNKNVLSDAKVAIACAHAAFYSSLYNVDINLHSIKDEDFKAKAVAKEQAMKAEMEELHIKF
jgi:formiminotetrahydrofolate cyclodeaminase